MLEKLKEIICNYVEVEPDTITVESRFVEDLNFNSYDLMCMIGDLEEAFDIKMDERQASRIITVQNAIDYIEALHA